MLTLDERITKIVGMFHKRFKTRNILKTTEEVEANTNEDNLASAVVVGELINNLKGFTPILDESGKITGYKTDVGGADTVFPFSGDYQITISLLFGYSASGQVANPQYDSLYDSKTVSYTFRIINGVLNYSATKFDTNYPSAERISGWGYARVTIQSIAIKKL